MGIKRAMAHTFVIVFIILAGTNTALSETIAVPETPVSNQTNKTDTNLTEPAQRIKYLSKEIRRHDYLYYTLGQPEISDKEYDLLVEELQTLQAIYPSLVEPDSPLARPGVHLLGKAGQIHHQEPMLSISKIHSEQEIDNFDQQVRKAAAENEVFYLVEPKIDGVAISLRYEKGQLIWAATRGDGKLGSNITKIILPANSIPKSLCGNDWPEILEVRGELYWPRKAFNDFNRQQTEQGLSPLLNSRNAVAGTLQLSDPDLLKARKLEFMTHGIGYTSEPINTSSAKAMAVLKTWGLPVVQPCGKLCKTADEIKNSIQKWKNDRHDANFDTDGIVIKVDSLAIRNALGKTSRAPRWCVAYKYAPRQAKTIIREVVFTVGRFGTITPVAHFDPVELSGAVISRASLNSLRQLDSINLFAGDTILVERAGEVIPQIAGVLTEGRKSDAKPIISPKCCPVCGSGLIDIGAERFCPNPACPAQIRRRVEHFAGRDQMNIEHIGSAIINQLVTAGLVKRCSDLYSLQYDELMALENIGPALSGKIIESIEESKARTLSQVLSGLGIRHIGPVNAQLLADSFGDIDTLISADEKALLAVKGIGPATAKSIRAFFTSEAGQEIIAELKSAGVNLGSTLDNNQQTTPLLPLKGKIFVVTGKLENFTRTEAILAIETAGGQVRRRVSKTTDYVVAGDNPGANADRAMELKIPMITEAQFKKMLNME